MKKLLGAIAAAMLLGAGCAHERSTTQTEAPSSPRASVGTAGVTNGLTCEVINGNTNTQGVSSSAPVTSESSDAWGGSSSESADLQQPGRSGSTWEDQSVSDRSVIEAPASSQEPIDDSALDQSAIGGSGPEMDVSGKTPDKAPVDDSASKSHSFEDTDMGGTGGGGG